MANDTLYVIARTILDEAETRLDNAGRPVPARRYVHAGQTAWDCDQLTVEITRVFAGQPGVEGLGLEDRESCVGLRTVEYLVELVRCFPTLNAAGAAPTMTALDYASQEIATDGWIIVQGLADAAAAGSIADTACDDVAIGTLLFPEPQGAMVGIKLPIQVVLS
jgi:hypothetical protein